MPPPDNPVVDFDAHFKVFHELMHRRVREILLVLSPYDAFVMEEEASLAARITKEYRGLNLSQPPRMTRVSSAEEALDLVRKKHFDLVITMPRLMDMDCYLLGVALKKIIPGLPVILLSHNPAILPALSGKIRPGIDRTYIWSANPELLLAIVKNCEDHLNADQDTRLAMVRILILVEDSPVYRSYFLPLIYKEVVRQTQAVQDDSLNEDHRLLKMRARPKILVAENYETAIALYRRYRPAVFGIISDTRFPKKGKLRDNAGLRLLQQVRQEIPDLPLLLLSSDPANRSGAEKIPAVFLAKQSPTLAAELHEFFLQHLAFGDFVFRDPDGREIDRAANLHGFEKKLARIPAQSLRYHADRNHFSNWVMARSEVDLAAKLHREALAPLKQTETLRQTVINHVHQLRCLRQQGLVGRFSARDYDAEVMDFVKIGSGSMGGKAIGLAFMASVFRQYGTLLQKFPQFQVSIPKTLVLTTDAFNSFMEFNGFADLDPAEDREVVRLFADAAMPSWLVGDLTAFLVQNTGPLTIRSSSLLEDGLFRPYAGLYETCMIPNNHPDLKVRLQHLLAAIRLVYASTYFAAPLAFSRSSGQAAIQESMALIIQHLCGRSHGSYFYPAIAGVAQSRNYYPVGSMSAEDGIAHIALGFGKTVVEGEKCLRFSPRQPMSLPQFSTVDEMLENAQRTFYALRLKDYPPQLNLPVNSNLERRELDDALDEFPVRTLCSTYDPEEHRIRDLTGRGYRVLTFAQVLKNRLIPLPEMIGSLLRLGRQKMGCDVEIEFSADLPTANEPGGFHFLQIRPMGAAGIAAVIDINAAEIRKALCYSDQALGHGSIDTIRDIIFVKQQHFSPAKTAAIAGAIRKGNYTLQQDHRPYLLVGPGRWGSADPLLGIPVKWQHISGVAAMIELRNQYLKADASQGTHFFQNITALGIPYLTVTEESETGGFIDWQWLFSQPQRTETEWITHIRLQRPLLVKVDGRRRQSVILKPESI